MKMLLGDRLALDESVRAELKRRAQARATRQERLKLEAKHEAKHEAWRERAPHLPKTYVRLTEKTKEVERLARRGSDAALLVQAAIDAQHALRERGYEK